jgi:hypothetical protein
MDNRDFTELYNSVFGNWQPFLGKRRDLNPEEESKRLAEIREQLGQIRQGASRIYPDPSAPLVNPILTWLADLPEPMLAQMILSADCWKPQNILDWAREILGNE